MIAQKREGEEKLRAVLKVCAAHPENPRVSTIIRESHINHVTLEPILKTCVESGLLEETTPKALMVYTSKRYGLTHTGLRVLNLIDALEQLAPVPMIVP